MKIEMGESLLYSWLRHVKECQIVQTNWKASPEWDKKNQDELQNMMNITNQYFEGKHGYKIYKNNSLDQLVKQAEVDVLGVSIYENRNHVYAIDVAFHSGGLNYGSKDETVACVIKKYIRTAMCLYGYMNLDEADIIFASPKITPAVMSELEPKIKEVNELFKSLNFKFKIRLIANEEFNSKILAPILIASDGISDTSELFLRSYQMFNMFADQSTAEKKPNMGVASSTLNELNSSVSDAALKELKIGKLVQISMKRLFEEERLSEVEIEKMTKADYSKRVFNANFPILIEVPFGSDVKKLRKDGNAYDRYYATTLTIYGKQYLLSAQWYENLNRSYYESWLASK